VKTRIDPVRKLVARTPVRIPGDKSISHRSLMFGAMAHGTTEVTNLLEGADVLSTWACMEAMGARIERTGSTIVAHGAGGLKAPARDLDCGNSGTSMRLLMGILAGQPFAARFVGDESLSRRPMKRISAPLIQMGAEIDLTGGNTAPLTVRGRAPLKPIDFTLPVASAQLKSAVLLAGIFAEGTTRVRGLIHSRDHTERLLPHFGVQVDIGADEISVRGGQKLTAAPVHVPGDISSAAFWIAAATLVPDTVLELKNISLNPSRVGILHALKRMGANIETELTAKHPEEVGTLRIRSARLKATTIEGDEIPALIDEIPMIAVLASQAEGTTIIRGAEELRVKETDRIEAVAKGLRTMGVTLETFEDGLSITGPQKLKGAQIDSELDHRIAMAFSIAGLIAEGPTEIDGSECVDISYPTFFTTLRELVS
jgi:3-phosphoshikimate 1-carboxyvinyltransferase